jgi:site-specific DNA-methyltransferase (adenine-specific)
MQLICGDSLIELPKFEDNSFDSIICDPPYGLGKVKDIKGLLSSWMNDEDGKEHVGSGGFMNKEWDKSVPSPKIWKECIRVLKPGGFMLVFAGTRTQDLMGISIRLAGGELVDEISFLGTLTRVFGEGMPKGQNISLEIDNKSGAEREIVGFKVEPDGRIMGKEPMANERVCNPKEKEDRKWGSDNRSLLERKLVTAPNTEDAKKWNGWYTGLKPAHEPILVFRKPISEKTFVDNILNHGCGAFNIDQCRIGHDNTQHVCGSNSVCYGSRPTGKLAGSSSGRFPSNLLLGHHPECIEKEDQKWECHKDCVCNKFPFSTSGSLDEDNIPVHGSYIFGSKPRCTKNTYKSSCGSANRFFKQFEFPQKDIEEIMFYASKANRKDRNEGLEDPGFQFVHGNTLRKVENTNTVGNTHVSVKPTNLMRYLCKLVTQPNGKILDPFMGSGSTLKAAILEGYDCVGIEMDKTYFEIAEKRIEHTVKEAAKEKEQLSLFNGVDK